MAKKRPVHQNVKIQQNRLAKVDVLVWIIFLLSLGYFLKFTLECCWALGVDFLQHFFLKNEK